MGMPVDMPWVSQPAAPGMLRSQLSWTCRPGTAAAITSALAGWKLLRFEITEEASPGCDAVRYSYTPSLGAFACVIGANGDIMIPESRLRATMTLATTPLPDRPASTLEEELNRLLGKPWDEELEPFRQAAEGAPVRWLHAAV